MKRGLKGNCDDEKRESDADLKMSIERSSDDVGRIHTKWSCNSSCMRNPCNCFGN
jgi:hypothetical protein